MAANFNPSVVFIDRLVKIVGHIAKVDLLGISKQVLRIVVQRPLITLEGQHLIAMTFNN